MSTSTATATAVVVTPGCATALNTCLNEVRAHLFQSRWEQAVEAARKGWAIHSETVLAALQARSSSSSKSDKKDKKDKKADKDGKRDKKDKTDKKSDKKDKKSDKKDKKSDKKDKKDKKADHSDSDDDDSDDDGDDNSSTPQPASTAQITIPTATLDAIAVTALASTPVATPLLSLLLTAKPSKAATADCADAAAVALHALCLLACDAALSGSLPALVSLHWAHCARLIYPASAPAAVAFARGLAQANSSGANRNASGAAAEPTIEVASIAYRTGPAAAVEYLHQVLTSAAAAINAVNAGIVADNKSTAGTAGAIVKPLKEIAAEAVSLIHGVQGELLCQVSSPITVELGQKSYDMAGDHQVSGAAAEAAVAYTLALAPTVTALAVSSGAHCGADNDWNENRKAIAGALGYINCLHESLSSSSSDSSSEERIAKVAAAAGIENLDGFKSRCIFSTSKYLHTREIPGVSNQAEFARARGVAWSGVSTIEALSQTLASASALATLLEATATKIKTTTTPTVTKEAVTAALAAITAAQSPSAATSTAPSTASKTSSSRVVGKGIIATDPSVATPAATEATATALALAAAESARWLAAEAPVTVMAASTLTSMTSPSTNATVAHWPLQQTISATSLPLSTPGLRASPEALSATLPPLAWLYALCALLRARASLLLAVTAPVRGDCEQSPWARDAAAAEAAAAAAAAGLGSALGASGSASSSAAPVRPPIAQRPAIAPRPPLSNSNATTSTSTDAARPIGFRRTVAAEIAAGLDAATAAATAAAAPAPVAAVVTVAEADSDAVWTKPARLNFKAPWSARGVTESERLAVLRRALPADSDCGDHVKAAADTAAPSLRWVTDVSILRDAQWQCKYLSTAVAVARAHATASASASGNAVGSKVPAFVRSAATEAAWRVLTPYNGANPYTAVASTARATIARTEAEADAVAASLVLCAEPATVSIPTGPVPPASAFPDSNTGRLNFLAEQARLLLKANAARVMPVAYQAARLLASFAAFPCAEDMTDEKVLALALTPLNAHINHDDSDENSAQPSSLASYLRTARCVATRLSNLAPGHWLAKCLVPSVTAPVLASLTLTGSTSVAPTLPGSVTLPAALHAVASTLCTELQTAIAPSTGALLPNFVIPFAGDDVFAPLRHARTALALAAAAALSANASSGDTAVVDVISLNGGYGNVSRTAIIAAAASATGAAEGYAGVASSALESKIALTRAVVAAYGNVTTSAKANAAARVVQVLDCALRVFTATKGNTNDSVVAALDDSVGAKMSAVSDALSKLLCVSRNAGGGDSHQHVPVLLLALLLGVCNSPVVTAACPAVAVAVRVTCLKLDTTGALTELALTEAVTANVATVTPDQQLLGTSIFQTAVAASTSVTDYAAKLPAWARPHFEQSSVAAEVAQFVTHAAGTPEGGLYYISAQHVSVLSYIISAGEVSAEAMSSSVLALSPAATLALLWHSVTALSQSRRSQSPGAAAAGDDSTSAVTVGAEMARWALLWGFGLASQERRIDMTSALAAPDLSNNAHSHLSTAIASGAADLITLINGNAHVNSTVTETRSVIWPPMMSLLQGVLTRSPTHAGALTGLGHLLVFNAATTAISKNSEANAGSFTSDDVESSSLEHTHAVMALLRRARLVYCAAYTAGVRSSSSAAAASRAATATVKSSSDADAAGAALVRLTFEYAASVKNFPTDKAQMAEVCTVFPTTFLSSKAAITGIVPTGVSPRGEASAEESRYNAFALIDAICQPPHTPVLTASHSAWVWTARAQAMALQAQHAQTPKLLLVAARLTAAAAERAAAVLSSTTDTASEGTDADAAAVSVRAAAANAAATAAAAASVGARLTDAYAEAGQVLASMNAAVIACRHAAPLLATVNGSETGLSSFSSTGATSVPVGLTPLVAGGELVVAPCTNQSNFCATRLNFAAWGLWVYSTASAQARTGSLTDRLDAVWNLHCLLSTALQHATANDDSTAAAELPATGAAFGVTAAALLPLLKNTCAFATLTRARDSGQQQVTESDWAWVLPACHLLSTLYLRIAMQTRRARTAPPTVPTALLLRSCHFAAAATAIAGSSSAVPGVVIAVHKTAADALIAAADAPASADPSLFARAFSVTSHNAIVDASQAVRRLSLLKLADSQLAHALVFAPHLGSLWADRALCLRAAAWESGPLNPVESTALQRRALRCAKAAVNLTPRDPSLWRLLGLCAPTRVLHQHCVIEAIKRAASNAKSDKFGFSASEIARGEGYAHLAVVALDAAAAAARSLRSNSNDNGLNTGIECVGVNLNVARKAVSIARTLIPSSPLVWLAIAAWQAATAAHTAFLATSGSSSATLKTIAALSAGGAKGDLSDLTTNAVLTHAADLIADPVLAAETANPLASAIRTALASTAASGGAGARAAVETATFAAAAAEHELAAAGFPSAEDVLSLASAGTFTDVNAFLASLLPTSGVTDSAAVSAAALYMTVGATAELKSRISVASAAFAMAHMLLSLTVTSLDATLGDQPLPNGSAAVIITAATGNGAEAATQSLTVRTLAARASLARAFVSSGDSVSATTLYATLLDPYAASNAAATAAASLSAAASPVPVSVVFTTAVLTSAPAVLSPRLLALAENAPWLWGAAAAAFRASSNVDLAHTAVARQLAQLQTHAASAHAAVQRALLTAAKYDATNVSATNSAAATLHAAIDARSEVLAAVAEANALRASLYLEQGELENAHTAASAASTAPLLPHLPTVPELSALVSIANASPDTFNERLTASQQAAVTAAAADLAALDVRPPAVVLQAVFIQTVCLLRAAHAQAAQSDAQAQGAAALARLRRLESALHSRECTFNVEAIKAVLDGTTNSSSLGAADRTAKVGRPMLTLPLFCAPGDDKPEADAAFQTAPVAALTIVPTVTAVTAAATSDALAVLATQIAVLEASFTASLAQQHDGTGASVTASARALRRAAAKALLLRPEVTPLRRLLYATAAASSARSNVALLAQLDDDFACPTDASSVYDNTFGTNSMSAALTARAAEAASAAAESAFAVALITLYPTPRQQGRWAHPTAPGRRLNLLQRVTAVAPTPTAACFVADLSGNAATTVTDGVAGSRWGWLSAADSALCTAYIDGVNTTTQSNKSSSLVSAASASSHALARALLSLGYIAPGPRAPALLPALMPLTQASSSSAEAADMPGRKTVFPPITVVEHVHRSIKMRVRFSAKGSTSASNANANVPVDTVLLLEEATADALLSDLYSMSENPTVPGSRASALTHATATAASGGGVDPSARGALRASARALLLDPTDPARWETLSHAAYRNALFATAAVSAAATGASSAGTKDRAVEENDAEDGGKKSGRTAASPKLPGSTATMHMSLSRARLNLDEAHKINSMPLLAPVDEFTEEEHSDEAKSSSSVADLLSNAPLCSSNSSKNGAAVSESSLKEAADAAVQAATSASFSAIATVGPVVGSLGALSRTVRTLAALNNTACASANSSLCNGTSLRGKYTASPGALVAFLSASAHAASAASRLQRAGASAGGSVSGAAAAVAAVAAALALALAQSGTCDAATAAAGVALICTNSNRNSGSAGDVADHAAPVVAAAVSSAVAIKAATIVRASAGDKLGSALARLRGCRICVSAFNPSQLATYYSCDDTTTPSNAMSSNSNASNEVSDPLVLLLRLAVALLLNGDHTNARRIAELASESQQQQHAAMRDWTDKIVSVGVPSVTTLCTAAQSTIEASSPEIANIAVSAVEVKPPVVWTRGACVLTQQLLAWCEIMRSACSQTLSAEPTVPKLSNESFAVVMRYMRCAAETASAIPITLFERAQQQQQQGGDIALSTLTRRCPSAAALALHVWQDIVVLAEQQSQSTVLSAAAVTGDLDIDGAAVPALVSAALAGALTFAYAIAPAQRTLSRSAAAAEAQSTGAAASGYESDCELPEYAAMTSATDAELSAVENAAFTCSPLSPLWHRLSLAHFSGNGEDGDASSHSNAVSVAVATLHARAGAACIRAAQRRPHALSRLDLCVSAAHSHAAAALRLLAASRAGAGAAAVASLCHLMLAATTGAIANTDKNADKGISTMTATKLKARTQARVLCHLRAAQHLDTTDNSNAQTQCTAPTSLTSGPLSLGRAGSVTLVQSAAYWEGTALTTGSEAETGAVDLLLPMAVAAAGDTAGDPAALVQAQGAIAKATGAVVSRVRTAGAAVLAGVQPVDAVRVAQQTGANVEAALTTAGGWPDKEVDKVVAAVSLVTKAGLLDEARADKLEQRIATVKKDTDMARQNWLKPSK